MFDPVAWWARVDGTRTALIEATSGVHHSYSSLDADANAWCTLLVAQGVKSGDRVAVLAQNRVEFIAMYYGCIRAGAALVPLNWRLSPPELARVLRDAECVVLLGEDRLRTVAEEAARLADCRLSARWVDLDREVPALLRKAELSASAAHTALGAADDTAMLLYTSGSTGTPKGVIVPHRQILFNAIATTTAWQLGASDVGPAATPFFHTGGWHVFTTTLLFRGGTVVLIDAFEPAAFLRMLERFGVTVTFGVPTQLAMLREATDWGRPLPKLRWFISGGAPCPQRIKREVREAGYRFREGYGLTECGPNCFATTDQTALAKDGTVGWPVPFLEMRLRADHGGFAEVDEVGELELRGPQLFGGYFRAPDKTAEVQSADGWLRTGDLASRDADGVFSIRGRRKDMFISGGENVFPGEVEAALLDCPGVAEVSVIGIPDERWGEVGCALIVRSDVTLSASLVIAHARAQVAGYKVPKRVQFVTAIPRLGSGKIDRTRAAMLIEQS